MAALTRLSKPSSYSFAVATQQLKRHLSLSLSTSISTSTSTEEDKVVVKSPSYPSDRERERGRRNVQWVFLGCPGVGKGTYASRLCTLLGVPHIATGDLVRHELQSHTTLSPQEILNEVTDIDLVVNLKLPEKVLIDKCLGRRICNECGKGFNVATIDMKGENGNPDISMAPLMPPSHCVSKLISRADDTETVVKERLRIYSEKSQPLEDFYRNQGKLLEFDLPGGIPESWPKLLEVLNLDDYEEKQSVAA